MTEIPKSNSRLKNILQASALVAEGFSKKSAGNVASKIVESGLDFSGSGGKQKNGEGVKGQTKVVDPFNEQNTNNAAGQGNPYQEVLGDFPSKKNSNYV